jgi:putative polyhydroxyalkanoate system protein
LPAEEVFMSSLTVSIPHQLPTEEAKKRVEQLIVNLQQDYGGMFGKLEKRWEGDTLAFSVSAMGVSLAGHVYVEPQTVRLDIPLPFPLAALAGGLKEQLEHEGRKLLESK